MDRFGENSRHRIRRLGELFDKRPVGTLPIVASLFPVRDVPKLLDAFDVATGEVIDRSLFFLNCSRSETEGWRP